MLCANPGHVMREEDHFLTCWEALSKPASNKESKTCNPPQQLPNIHCNQVHGKDDQPSPQRKMEARGNSRRPKATLAQYAKKGVLRARRSGSRCSGYVRLRQFSGKRDSYERSRAGTIICQD